MYTTAKVNIKCVHIKWRNKAGAMGACAPSGMCPQGHVPPGACAPSGTWLRYATVHMCHSMSHKTEVYIISLEQNLVFCELPLQ